MSSKLLLLGVAGLSVGLVAGCGSSTSVADGGPDDASAGDTGTPMMDGAVDTGTPDAPPGPGDAGPCIMQPPVVPPLRIIPVTGTAAGFSTFAAQPPGSSDWYIVEQAGRIRIIRNGAFLSTPFLDITAAMGSNFGERGLLSVAFHPSYAQNGRFFTMATPADNPDGSYAASNADAVVEWKRDPNNPDVAVPTKVRDIVVLPASASNHNGGTIKFGPDKLLYVGTGDGGGGCESNKPGQVQDPTMLFGKMLRLDVDAAPPFAAAGNPFANDARVFLYGLRNPYRFNFDRVTLDLVIGDVGQNAYEEISIAPWGMPGKNFGWPAYEGAVQGTCSNKQLGGPSPYTAPIVSIDRTQNSTSPFKDYSSIVGGTVYRGAMVPALQGVMLFADFYGAELGALRYCNGQVFGPVAVPLSSIMTPTTLNAISSFVEGNDGELYVTYGYGTRIGRIAAQ